MRHIVSSTSDLRDKGGKDAKTATARWLLLWIALAVLRHAALKHPVSPNLYDTLQAVLDGGETSAPNFGGEKDGFNLPTEDGHTPQARHYPGYPDCEYVLLKKLGWWDERDGRR